MFVVSSGKDYNPNELKPNSLNVEIYGDELVDKDLMESLKRNGQIESVIIKEDKTIVSGHRRWLALKTMGIDKVRCEVRSFTDITEEQEVLIECNRQRKKTASQIYNEVKVLEKIEKDKAAKRQIILAGSRHGGKTDLPINLSEGIGKKGDSRSILAKKIGVPETRLETIMEVGKLAETGEPKTARKSVNINKTKSITAPTVETQQEEEKKRKEVVKQAPSIKRVAKQLMKDLDENKTPVSVVRDAIKTINETPSIAKDIEEAKKITPERSIKDILRESKANKNRLAYVGSLSNSKIDSNAWYTPKIYMDAVREVIGDIELDPYSDEIANSNVNAKNYYTIDNPAETKEWKCKTLWMNPPYTAAIMKPAVNKFVSEYRKYNFNAIVITNNATETQWFNTLVTNSKCFCFTNHRIAFETYDGKNESNNTRGQVFFYFGNNIEKFKHAFNKFGWCGAYDGE
ncbi:MAG: ParB N-terminal domain-containing protein [Clostridia bacterium]|jgi:ParB-like chromosome segregation protein Spo0J|nr:ParB N-terminal domain-containing protein [Clostridia bacterium]